MKAFSILAIMVFVLASVGVAMGAEIEEQEGRLVYVEPELRGVNVKFIGDPPSGGCEGNVWRLLTRNRMYDENWALLRDAVRERLGKRIKVFGKDCIIDKVRAFR